MGILLEDAELIADRVRRGTRLGRVLTLGRQQLFFEPEALASRLALAGASAGAIAEFTAKSRDGGAAEPLFYALGAETVESVDHSAYEGAGLLHDLNQPIPAEWHGRYDFVFDGGTLEHVFNFPVAIRNAMELVREGGSLVLIAPSNGFSGHGFYQFSPELFYNVFSETNGYSVESMIALEISPAHFRRSVKNPAVLKQRVPLKSSWPVNLFIHAARKEIVPIFRTMPQQSDYQALWRSSGESPALPAVALKRAGPRRLKRLLPALMPEIVYSLATFKRVFFDRAESLKDGRFFDEVDS